MRRPGFTLMELTIVTGLIVLTLSATLPFLSVFRQTETLRTVSQDVFKTLALARHRAQTSEQGRPWGVRMLQGSYVLYAGYSYTEREEAYDDAHAVSGFIAFSGAEEITFQKKSGMPAVPGTVTLWNANGDSVSITVNAVGRITFD